jgi:multiple sugar transport system substrate-binding protein
LNYFASFAADGLLYKADEMVSPDVQADIIQTFRDNSKYQGVEDAVPDLASDRLFFYNTDIFTKAGITAAPQTWDDLTADCAKIKASDPSITPLALPLGPEEAQGEFLMWAGGNGGGVFKDGKWVINSPENVATLKFLKALVDSKCTESSPGTFNRTAGAFALFSSGKAAMVNGSVFFPGVLTTNKSTVKYSEAPVPHATGKTSITLGVQDYWFAFKKPGNSNQPAVRAFMDFMYQPDNYAAFLKAAGGFLPATKSAGLVADPALKPFIDVLPSAIFYPSDQAAWPAVQTAIQQTIGTSVQGTDPQKVLDQIQAKATAAGQ